MEGDGLIKLSNELLAQINVPRRIHKEADVDSSLFVTLYEGLCGEKIPDVIRKPRSREDDVHNCQCVIDSLAMDILHTSLSHITGEDIVNHNSTAVYNLLEIFSGLMEFILHKIEKECSSENEDRPASVDSAERGLQQQLAASHAPEAGDRSGGGSGAAGAAHRADTPTSPTNAVAAGVQRVLDEKQMQSPDRKRPRVERDSSSLKSSARRPRATPQPLLRPLASSSLQSIVVPSSSDTNYETDSTAGAPSDRESRKDVRPRKGGAARSTVTFDLHEVGRHATSVRDESSLSRKRRPAGREEPLQSPIVRSASAASATRLEAAANGRAAAVSDAVDCKWSDGPWATAPAAGQPPGQAGRAMLPPIEVGRPSAAGEQLHYDAGGGRRAEPPGPSRRVAESGGRGRPRVVDDGDRHRSGADLGSGRGGRKAALSDELATRILHTGESTAELIELANATFTKEEQQQPRGGARFPQLSAHSASASPASAATAAGAAFADRPVVQAPVPAPAAAEAVEAPDLRTGDSRRAAGASSQQVITDVPRGSGYPGNRTACDDGLAAADQQPDQQRRLTGLAQPERPHWAGEDLTRALHPDRSSGNLPGTADGSCSAAPVLAALPSRSRRQTGQVEQTAGMQRDEPAALRVDDSTRGVLPTRRHVSFLKDRSQSEASPHGQESFSRRDAESPLWQGLRDYVSSRPAAGPAAVISVPGTDEPAAKRLNAGLGDRAPSADRGGRTRQVRFEGQSSSSALQTAVTGLERTLDTEARLEARRRLVLGKLYRNGLEEITDDYKHAVKDEKHIADQRDALYRRQLRSMSALKSRNTNIPGRAENARPKGFLLPRDRILRPAPAPTAEKRAERSDEGVHSDDRRHQLDPEDDSFIPALLDEFPHVDVAPETIRDMWRQHWRQAKLVSKAAAEVKRKKSHAQAQMEEAERKQRLLMHIMKKDISLGQRVRQRKLQEKAAKQARHELQERRLQTARVRRYYDEYAVQTRSKMLRSRTREEQIFKDLFRKGLAIQKQRIGELRSYAKEVRHSRAAEQQLDIEALENYYQDQFNMLAESATKERQEWQLREAAQATVLNKIKKEMRERMEGEIQRFQDQLLQGEDDAHFRQLDADRIQLQLKLTRLQTGL